MALFSAAPQPTTTIPSGSARVTISVSPATPPAA